MQALRGGYPEQAVHMRRPDAWIGRRVAGDPIVPPYHEACSDRRNSNCNAPPHTRYGRALQLSTPRDNSPFTHSYRDTSNHRFHHVHQCPAVTHLPEPSVYDMKGETACRACMFRLAAEHASHAPAAIPHHRAAGHARLFEGDNPACCMVQTSGMQTVSVGCYHNCQ